MTPETERRHTDAVILAELLKVHEKLDTIMPICEKVNTHNNLLYGDSRAMGRGGIIYELNAIKRISIMISGFVGLVVAGITNGLIMSWKFIHR